MVVKKPAPAPQPRKSAQLLAKPVTIWMKIADETPDPKMFADRIISELYGYDWKSPAREIDRDQIANAFCAWGRSQGAG